MRRRWECSGSRRGRAGEKEEFECGPRISEFEERACFIALSNLSFNPPRPRGTETLLAPPCPLYVVIESLDLRPRRTARARACTLLEAALKPDSVSLVAFVVSSILTLSLSLSQLFLSSIARRAVAARPAARRAGVVVS